MNLDRFSDVIKEEGCNKIFSSNPSNILSKINEKPSESFESKKIFFSTKENSNSFNNFGKKMTKTEENVDPSQMLKEIMNKKNKEKLKMTLLTKKRFPIKKSYVHKKVRKETVIERNSQEEIEKIRNKYFHSSLNFMIKNIN